MFVCCCWGLGFFAVLNSWLSMLLFFIPPDGCWDLFSLFLDRFIRLFQMCCVCFGPDEAVSVHCVESFLHKLFPFYLEGSVMSYMREGSGLFLYRTLLFLCCYSVFTQAYWYTLILWIGKACSVLHQALSLCLLTLPLLFNEQNLLHIFLMSLVHTLSPVL